MKKTNNQNNSENMTRLRYNNYVIRCYHVSIIFQAKAALQEAYNKLEKTITELGATLETNLQQSSAKVHQYYYNTIHHIEYLG